MHRRDADRVLALVAEISGDLRGRIVAERWWLVWIAVGADMLAACAVLHFLLRRENAGPALPVSLLAGNVAVVLLLIRFIHRCGGGQRTATEGYLWRIWTTYILGTFGVCLFDALAGAPLFTSAPLFALLAAFAFAMMAMLIHPFFLVHAVFFTAVMAAMAIARDYQFLLLGGAWFGAMLALGLYYRLHDSPEKARRL
jgi:hypothetical protein